MSRKIIKKAYKIDLSKIEEGYLYSEEVVYANSRGKAKQLLDLGNYTLSNGDEVNFLNAPVIRSKQDDIYLVDGVEITQNQIDYNEKLISRNNEFDLLLKENPNGKAYIMKGGIYWRPNKSGYTEFKRFAGVYDLKDAVDTCKSSDLGRFERPVLINIKEHNELINKTIKDLETRILK